MFSTSNLHNPRKTPNASNAMMALFVIIVCLPVFGSVPHRFIETVIAFLYNDGEDGEDSDTSNPSDTPINHDAMMKLRTDIMFLIGFHTSPNLSITTIMDLLQDDDNISIPSVETIANLLYDAVKEERMKRNYAYKQKCETCYYHDGKIRNDADAHIVELNYQLSMIVWELTGMLHACFMIANNMNVENSQFVYAKFHKMYDGTEHALTIATQKANEYGYV